jgi:hypothetical protein
MKKLTLIILALLMAGITKAQTNKEEVDYFQSIFGMEKKKMVADFVNVDLDATKSAAFWTLYDEYEAKRKELGKERIELLKQYAENYDKMTPETADSWMKEVIKLGSSTDKLILTYYKKVKKATDPIVALKFYHIENYILTGIRVSILEEIPFVKAKK